MPLEITTTELPPPTVGESYRARLEATGGGTRVRRPAFTLDEWTRVLLDPNAEPVEAAPALDILGNWNGRLDVGDFRAWLLALED